MAHLSVEAVLGLFGLVTELFPIYAMPVIALSVIYMTIVLALERRRAPLVLASVPAPQI